MQITGIDYSSLKELGVTGRYLNADHIVPVLKKWNEKFSVTEAGNSVQGEPIFRVTLGSGPTNILIWSQMHGNESTTTKAVLDLIACLGADDTLSRSLLSACTITILPMLNPDGARDYTRTNARGIDLNRDARDQSQPESVVLRKEFDRAAPHFCFNLHDQRTIFNVGERPLPATVSFLAPAFDANRSVSGCRELSMKLIAGINQQLQQLIPGQVGRYDDSFNPNCVGDSFQSLNTPTVLFEAGHYPGDYQRERTREYIFLALLQSLQLIAKNNLSDFETNSYFSIPENNKRFYDIIVRNPALLNGQWEEGVNLGIQYKEVLQGDTIHFQPQLEEAGLLKNKFGHLIFDCNNGSDLKKIHRNAELLQLLN